MPPFSSLASAVRPAALFAFALALPFLSACGKKSDRTGGTPMGSASASAAPPTANGAASTTVTAATTPSPRIATMKPFEPSFPVPPFKGAFPHVSDPTVNEARRLVDLTYASPAGEPNVAPLFTLTNHGDKAVRVNQTILFYYDDAGRRLELYPHSLGGMLTLAPGESKEERLGRATKDLKPDTVTLEGEVTSAYVGDDAWFNENLSADRPMGGWSPDQLVAMAGERVIVDVYAVHGFKVRLTNVADRQVKELSLSFLYFDAKGRAIDSAWPENATLAIKPGESVDATLKSTSGLGKQPPKAVSVAAYAWRVVFADGTLFENRNIENRFPRSEDRRLPPRPVGH